MMAIGWAVLRQKRYLVKALPYGTEIISKGTSREKIKNIMGPLYGSSLRFASILDDLQPLTNQTKFKKRKIVLTMNKKDVRGHCLEHRYSRAPVIVSPIISKHE